MHSLLYDNAKILPIYQKQQQWKESAEQEANKKAKWLPIKVHSVLYHNAKILPIYQKQEQWKESAEEFESAESTESNSKTETKIPLIQEIESMDKIRTGEIWIDAI